MDKKVVRASYESCLDSTARLAAYATSKPFLKACEVNERQDILAADDLIGFCIHARRLVDNVGLFDLTNQATIGSGDGTSLSLWKIIGALVHHDELEILRCATRVRILKARIESKSDKEYWNRVTPELYKGTYSEPIAPIVLFKSDKIARTAINLVEFLQIFSQKIIPEIIKKASDNGLHLDDFSLD